MLRSASPAGAPLALSLIAKSEIGRMAYKEFHFQSEDREGPLRGAKALTDAVRITLAGGRVVSEDVGVKLENVDISYLGRAQRIVIDRENTKIIGGRDDKKLIEARKNQLRQLIDKTTSDYDRDKLK